MGKLSNIKENRPTPLVPVECFQRLLHLVLRGRSLASLDAGASDTDEAHGHHGHRHRFGDDGLGCADVDVDADVVNDIEHVIVSDEESTVLPACVRIERTIYRWVDDPRQRTRRTQEVHAEIPRVLCRNRRDRQIPPVGVANGGIEVVEQLVVVVCCVHAVDCEIDIPHGVRVSRTREIQVRAGSGVVGTRPVVCDHRVTVTSGCRETEGDSQGAFVDVAHDLVVRDSRTTEGQLRLCTTDTVGRDELRRKRRGGREYHEGHREEEPAEELGHAFSKEM